MPNPTVEKLYEGCKLVKENNIDLILAVGGGSVCDYAKAVSVSAYCEENPWEKYYLRMEDVNNKIVPVGCVLTMVGTGSEMNGGAVVISQYIGRNEHTTAGEASSQLFTSSMLLSFMMAAVILLVNEPLMRMMFGRVEADVMDACVSYLRISAYSYPALAAYNAGAALYRSFGKTSTTMYISVIANLINVAGNLIGVFVLQAGVAGVAYPSLIARVFSAVAITFFVFQERIRYATG